MLEPTPVAPVIAPEHPILSPPTTEALAQQIAALQNQVNQLMTQFASLSQSFGALELVYKLHTHQVSSGQYVASGANGILYTVPCIHFDDVLDNFGDGGPPGYAPVFSGPPSS